MSTSIAAAAAASARAADPGDRRMKAAVRALGVGEDVAEELTAYFRNHFRPVTPEALDFPLDDEACVATWQEYVREADELGVWNCLTRYLVQLRFPIAAGISHDPVYRAATRRGRLPEGAGRLRLRDPASLRLWLHPTPAGRIPVLVAGDRADFVDLLRALTRRNEPDPIPDATGACIVGGLNNWDRVRRLRCAWEADHPRGTEQDWQQHFRSIVPRKELYQDRLILLSRGGYSGIAAERIGLHPHDWNRLSLRIRLEHECSHYFTRRVLGSMRNALHDELIADYCGIRLAIGAFRKDWFLLFFGLERFPDYRAGARLQCYLGEPPLSAAAAAAVHAVAVRAADQLERLGVAIEHFERPAERARLLLALTRISLPELAAADGADRVRATLAAPPAVA